MRELSDGARDGHRVCVSRAAAFSELSCRDECCEAYDTLTELRLNRQRKKFSYRTKFNMSKKEFCSWSVCLNNEWVFLRFSGENMRILSFDWALSMVSSVKLVLFCFSIYGWDYFLLGIRILRTKPPRTVQELGFLRLNKWIIVVELTVDRW